MISLGGSEAYGDVSGLDAEDDWRALGGRMKDDDDDDDADEQEDAQRQNAMDVGPDEQQQEQEQAEPLIIFPDPRPAIEFEHNNNQREGQRRFRFQAERIPAAVNSFAANVIRALSTLDELSSKQKAMILMHPCMPMPVCASPLVALFEAVEARGSVRQRRGTALIPQHQQPWKHCVISFLESCMQLQTLKFAAHNGMIAFHSSFATHCDALLRADLHYLHQLRELGAAHDAALDELFRRTYAATGQAPPSDAHLAEFASLLERYSLQYIHLLEHHLYTLLVAPFVATDNLALEHVLTPNDTPSLNACHNQARILQHATDFFHYKQELRNEQERANATAQHVGEDALTTSRIETHAIADLVRAEPPQSAALHRGYIHKRTLLQYWAFLDCGGIMQGRV